MAKHCTEFNYVLEMFLRVLQQDKLDFGINNSRVLFVLFQEFARIVQISGKSA